MQVKDVPSNQVASFLNDSQDVKPILERIGCDEDYGGLFVMEDGRVLGIEGIIPYNNKSVYAAGVLEN